MAVEIRTARESDAAAIADIYRPIVEETTISFETTAPDANEMARRIADTLTWFPWLVCDLDGRLAGYAYASRHRVRAAYQWSVDTSVYVDPEYRRLGIGRALYQSLFAILAAQGSVNAFAGIALPTAGSVGLHEAAGFVRIGTYRRVGYKLGAWRDVGWWQLELGEPDGVPAAPAEMAAMRRRGDWPSLLARGESAIRT
jgi:phosphinothricin acetyltransferase